MALLLLGKRKDGCRRAPVLAEPYIHLSLSTPYLMMGMVRFDPSGHPLQEKKIKAVRRETLNRSLPYIQRRFRSLYAPAAFSKWFSKIENATGFLYI
jgi:hypothetical protein